MSAEDTTTEGNSAESDKVSPDGFRTCSSLFAVSAGFFLFLGVGPNTMYDEVAMAIRSVGAGIGLALIAMALAIIYNASLHDANT